MDKNKVKITIDALVDGEQEVYGLDGSEGMIILTQHGKAINEYGIVDDETRVQMVAAALMNLPLSVRNIVIRCVQQGNKEPSKPVILN